MKWALICVVFMISNAFLACDAKVLHVFELRSDKEPIELKRGNMPSKTFIWKKRGGKLHVLCSNKDML